MLNARVVSIALLVAWPAIGWSKSWCAAPLEVHEWGVQVFDANGSVTSASASLPSYFHRQAAHGANRARVSDLPADGGERELPVLQFYAPPYSSAIPLGLAVGFGEGAATSWFPQVDVLRAAASANSAAARQISEGLVRARGQLTARTPRGPLPDDPTRQLQWQALSLGRTAAHAPARTDAAWVQKVRDMKDALWVDGASESERFVFYEAKTHERVPLTLTRGPTYSSTHRHYILANHGAYAVHDVFIVHRDGNDVFVFQAPAIPKGASAGFVLEDHRVAAAQLRAETTDALRGRLVDSVRPRYVLGNGAQPCVMGRDPAVPAESALGHALFTDEADLLLEVWRAAFFDRPGTTIVYREDPAYLDRVMPISIFTDMHYFVQLHRAGLAVWQGVVLP